MSKQQKKPILIASGLNEVSVARPDSRVLFSVGGMEVEVQYDRHTDALRIRSTGFGGGLCVYPEVSNVIRVGIAHRK